MLGRELLTLQSEKREQNQNLKTVESHEQPASVMAWHSQPPLIQRHARVGVSLAAQLDVLSVDVPVSVKALHCHFWFVWNQNISTENKIKKNLIKVCVFFIFIPFSGFTRLTLNVEGDAVGEDLLVVAGNTGERLLVRLSAGHQDVVALNRKSPVRVPVLAGADFSRHARLPTAPVNKRSVGDDEQPSLI